MIIRGRNPMTKVFGDLIDKKREFADKIGQFTDKDVQKLSKRFWPGPRDLKVILAVDAINKHQHCRLGIFVKKRDIHKQKSSNSYEFINGKARLFREGYGKAGLIEVNCIVACGNWRDLLDCKSEIDIYTRLSKPTRDLFSLSEDLNEGINMVDYFGKHPRYQHNFANYSQGLLGCNFEEEINIVDHLDKLLPQRQKSIGLFTFQNGIQNTHLPKAVNNEKGDLEKMGQSIISSFEVNEKPLCIGMYNATNGIKWGIMDDLIRFKHEWSLNCNSVLSFRQMACTFADLLPLINQKTHWVHIAHSEASLIANEALTGRKGFALGYRRANVIRNHLITATYGGVDPIPNIVHHAVNNYSTHDITTHWYAPNYLDKKPKPCCVYVDQAMKHRAREIYEGILFDNDGSTSTTFEDVHESIKKSYSEKDYITKYPHESNKDNYALTVIESVDKDGNPLPIGINYFPSVEGDHAFQGKTYQTKLLKDIKNFRTTYGGIYCGR